MDIMGATPFVIVSAVVTWIGQGFLHRERMKKEKQSHDDRLEIHRDELTFQLLQGARTEMNAARSEMEGLREEVRTLRALEQHFYHFQQSLDHLEAVLQASTPSERALAEHNARAFLNRMRRLADVRGTLRNEAQRMDSAIEVAERAIKDAENDTD